MRKDVETKLEQVMSEENLSLSSNIEELIKENEVLTTNLGKANEMIKQRDSFQVLSERNIAHTSIECLNALSYSNKIETITSYCIEQDDVLEAVDGFILGSGMSDNEKFDLCCSFAIKIRDYGDRFQGVGYINNARYFLSNNVQKRKEQYSELIKLLVILDEVKLAIDLQMEYIAQYGFFSEDINKKLAEEYTNLRSVSQKQQQHGHALLIDYIEKKIQDNHGQGRVLVEIGTTRESIPGQGSTVQLAELCKRKGIRFITVDMDPHNTRWANFISIKLGLNIEAITKRGEDYLREDIEKFDFVFLDAYDFNHGEHSELRQTRYEKYMGSRIDEEECHIMHLDCAKSVVEKLKKDGVVCVDDTWKDQNGDWRAKGTLAIPYFLENGLNIKVERNKALLMCWV